MDDLRDTDGIIGGNLRTWRQRRGLSQKALGDVAGITYQQIHKYESGENRVAASHLLAFARLLAVPVELFFSGIDDIEMPGDPQEIARVQRCAGTLAGVPEPFRSMIENLVTAFHAATPKLAAREVTLPPPVKVIA